MRRRNTVKANETAIFCDLDGTLFDHTGAVSERNRSAIRRYVEAGGLFAIATGRCPDNMYEFLEGVAINAPSVVLNGAGVWDGEQNRYLYTRFADREAIARVLRYCRERHPLLDLQIYTPEHILYVSPEETVNRPFWELHRTSCFVSIEEAERSAWFKALVFGDRETLRDVEAFLLAQNLADRFDRVYATTDIVPGSEYLELLPKGANKGTALHACRALDCYKNRTLIGVGDYNNDVELLIEADIAACPANANDAVQRISDVHLPSNNDHAIAALIDRLAELEPKSALRDNA